MKKWKKLIKDLFRKNDEDVLDIPLDSTINFILKLDNLKVGYLSFDEYWHFKYADEFKKEIKNLHTVPGFSDINKEYTNKHLWPFFKVRIPGLKQPAVKEIIKDESLRLDEVSLLKRFGFKSIASPYILAIGS